MAHSRGVQDRRAAALQGGPTLASAPPAPPLASGSLALRRNQFMILYLTTIYRLLHKQHISCILQEAPCCELPVPHSTTICWILTLRRAPGTDALDGGGRQRCHSSAGSGGPEALQAGCGPFPCTLPPLHGKLELKNGFELERSRACIGYALYCWPPGRDGGAPEESYCTNSVKNNLGC